VQAPLVPLVRGVPACQVGGAQWPQSLEEKCGLQLVECVVLNPASTVSDESPAFKSHACAWMKCIGWTEGSADSYSYMMCGSRRELSPQWLLAMCGLLIVLVVAMAAAGVYSAVESEAANVHCPVLPGPLHMKMSGQCDGSLHSRCVYQGCDGGYDMRRAAAPSIPLIDASGGDSGSTSIDRLVVSRECTAAGEYDGDPMVCVRRQCPAVTITCSGSSGCCVGCDGQDIRLSLPATLAPIPCGPHDPLCVPPPPVVAHCPASTHYGQPTVRCLPNGRWYAGASDSGAAVNGTCTRKACRPLTHTLAGYETVKYMGAKYLQERRDNQITFPEVVEGNGALTIKCASPEYKGSLTMTCRNGSTEWSDLKGGCEWQHCPAQLHNAAAMNLDKADTAKSKAQQGKVAAAAAAEALVAAASPRPLFVSLPNLSVGHALMISCCSSFTPGGGCAGSNDGIGEVQASCSLDKQYTVIGHCEAPDEIGIGLSTTASSAVEAADNTGTAPHEAATNGTGVRGLSKAYSTLLAGVGQQVSESTGGVFTLPSAGVFGALSMRRGTEWRPVVTVAASWVKTGTLATGAHETDQGGRAVALGNVACRQMGFAGASFVTNCRGLHLLSKGAGASAGLDQLYHSLGCSSSDHPGAFRAGSSSTPTWKAWITVDRSLESSANANWYDKGQWLPAAAANRSFHGPPPWAVHDSWAESFCVGNEPPVAPVGTSPCDIDIDTASGGGGGGSLSSPPQRGICAESGAVAHCYRDQLTRHLLGASTELHSLDTQLLLACTGSGSTEPDGTTALGKADLDSCGDVGGGTPQTWLAGDGRASPVHDDLAKPKIFANTLPQLTSFYRTDTKAYEESPHRNSTTWSMLDAAAVAAAGYYDGAWAGDAFLGEGLVWSDRLPRA
jgi:hypothetical protein